MVNDFGVLRTDLKYGRLIAAPTKYHSSAKQTPPLFTIHRSPFTVHCFYQWADRVVRPYSESAFMVVGHDHWACRVFESVCEADTSVIHYSLFTIHCSLNKTTMPVCGRLIATPTKYHSSAKQTPQSFTFSP